MTQRKRGSVLNEGEKAVVCLNIEASVITVSGQIRFQGADKRWETDEHTTVGLDLLGRSSSCP